MKKIMILMSVMLSAFWLMGCGNDVESAGNTESVIEEAETNDSQTIEMDSKEQSAEKEAEDSSSETTEDYNYIESEDLYFIDKIDIGDGTQVADFSTMEIFSTHYVIPESIDIYSYFGTYAGYTKPDIEIRSFRRNDEWIRISFLGESFLVKTEDFDKVAQIVDEVKPENIENDMDDSGNQDFTVTPGTPEMNAGASSPIQNETQETGSNSYTAEDAIATYRSIFEANGITFDPSLKEYASWGTGFLPLDKGQVEALANSSVESYAMGDSVGNSWTKYYLEVTGSDEDYVYFTEYHGY